MKSMKLIKLSIVRVAIPVCSGAATALLSGCATTITHNVAYDLNPHVERASAHESVKPAAKAAVEVKCVGARAESYDIAKVNHYHCEKPPANEILSKGNPLYAGAIIHILHTPEPIGRYVERAASAALASGMPGDTNPTIKLVLELERFDYDENCDRRGTKGVVMPWHALTGDADGIMRKGYLTAVAKVQKADGTVAYQRRVAIDVARQRGQTSAGVTIAAIGIGVVSPVTINPDAWREKEEKTVTADVIVDIFAKFQDELATDEDLLRALQIQPLTASSMRN
jgi:hypothetical protein